MQIEFRTFAKEDQGKDPDVEDHHHKCNRDQKRLSTLHDKKIR